MEPILTPSNNRLVLFPIKYDDLYNLYKKSVASFWSLEEIDLSKDKEDYESLSDGEKKFVSSVLAFFAASDGLVNENILGRFATEVQICEARSFYAAQAFFESIHGETYSALITSLIADPLEQSRLLKGVENIPAIRAKAQWMIDWIACNKPFAERLVAFACVEGIAFSSAFAALFYLRTKNKCHGLTFANELISRDEGLHTDFACALFNHLEHKPSQRVVHEIVRQAVDLERDFCCDALPVTLMGIDCAQMTEYVEFVADRLLVALGYDRLYPQARCSLSYMEAISLQGKTNFFERRVGEYQLASQAGGSKIFTLEEDF